MRRRIPISVLVSAAVLAAARPAATASSGVDWREVRPESTRELRRLFDRPLEGLQAPARKECYVYCSELTPAFLFLSTSNVMRLFDRIAEFGLGPPTHVGYVSAGGVRVAGRGTIDDRLAESWVLVWFSGSPGWDRIARAPYVNKHLKDENRYGFDVPFIVSLARKPRSVRLDEAGLEFRFDGEAGAVQMMPLTGVDRPRLDATARWSDGLSRETVRQARAWNARLKHFPAQVEESYAVDPARGTVTLIHDVRFVDVPDEWGTRGTADAPVPPAIALAAAHGFPVRFSGETLDTKCPTYFGPLWVVPGRRQVRIEVPGVLDLATKVLVPDVDPNQGADILRKIDERLRDRAAESGAGWWAAAGVAMAQGRKAALLPYVSDKTATLVKAATMRYMHGEVFGGEKTVERFVDEKRGRVYLVDYVNHHQRYAGDDEAPASEILRGTFNYAFHTGDWETVRRHWTELTQAAVASYVKNNWVMQSRPNSGGDTFHDVIVGTAAMARMAAVLGEESEFGLFSYLLARHLVAYYGFEYAALEFARAYRPWFVPLSDGHMVVWDIYEPFGALFAPVEAGGYYGSFTGFFEHYFRMDDDVMPRFYRGFLPQHTNHVFRGLVQKHLGGLPKKERGKWAFLFKTRARFLGESEQALRAWLTSSPLAADGDAAILSALYDARRPRKLVEILNLRLRRTLRGEGIHLQSNGTGHHSLDLDVRTSRHPGVYWFGFNASNAQTKPRAHGGNVIEFGVTTIGEGGVVRRTDERPNWVTRVYGFDMSRATEEQKAAARDQATATWMVVGPFGERRDGETDWGRAFPPEQGVREGFAKTFDGPLRFKDDGDGKKGSRMTLRWQERRMAGTDSGKRLPDYTLNCRWGFNHFGTTYACTRVRSPRAMSARFAVGTRGWRKVWINGRLAHEGRRSCRRVVEGADVFDGSLRAGWNTILVRLRNVEFWERFHFRIMDEDEQAIPGLVFDPRGR